jgi:hypothetical protein
MLQRQPNCIMYQCRELGKFILHNLFAHGQRLEIMNEMLFVSIQKHRGAFGSIFHLIKQEKMHLHGSSQGLKWRQVQPYFIY